MEYFNTMFKNKIIIDYRWSGKSGIGRHADFFLEYLLNTGVFKEIILLKSPQQKIKKEILDDIRIDCIDIHSKLYSISEQFEIPLKIPKKEYLFWSPNYNAPILIIKNKFVHIHDLAHYEMTGLIKKAYAFIFMLLNIITSKKILTVSEVTKNKLIQLFSLIKIDKKIEVIYPGVTPMKILDSQSEKNIILSIGNIKKRKNFIVLVEAFTKLKSQMRNDLKLVIVGKKEGLNDIDHEALKYESNEIIFSGEISDIELQKFFSKTKLFVFPSIYEGFGIPPIEAMSMKIPVLASKIPVFEEVYGDGAWFFDSMSSDSLLKKMKIILNSKPKADELILKGLNQAKKYTWLNYSKQFIRILNES